MTPILEIDDLHTHFFTRDGVVRAIEGLSLTVQAGEVLGIVGESGCGKSVTALSVMRLIPASAGGIVKGQVRFEGKDLAILSEPQMRSIRGNQIAMVFQEPMTSLNPVMRVGQQISEVLRWHRSLQGEAARQESIALLQRVEMPDPQRQINAYPHELSGGMRQRVMIAIALAGRPRLLIADEPTTALDVTIQAQILELIRKIQRDDGMSVLLITHDLGVIAEMCDRVAVMYAGRVVEQGTVMDIFDRPAHPYTRGLLASRPKIAAGANWLSTIEGTVPAVGQMGGGCSFAPRCKLASPDCAQRPALREVGPSHLAACVTPFERMSDPRAQTP